jgi:hypothetical protein
MRDNDGLSTPIKATRDPVGGIGWYAHNRSDAVVSAADYTPTRTIAPCS